MNRRYRIFDVFTDRPFAGNQLAIVLDSEGLDESAMQVIGREFNLSETVFVLPAENPGHTARVRIFTPAQELPFAGHPTVGAAVCLARERLAGLSGSDDAVIVLDEQVGPVRCAVKLTESGGFAEFDCPKLPEIAGAGGSKEAIAAALGLAPTEIGFENHVPSFWSAGVPYYLVPVRNMAVLAKAGPGSAAWAPAFGREAAFLYTRETEGHDHSFRARMFAPEIGIAEDPATGSAVAAFAGAIREFDALPDGSHARIVEQGFDMGRPSLIRLEMTVAAGALTAVRIGGDAVLVMEGTLLV
jgi:trans-2,3-dihydro-3-hydroxyanthranilate isomerase